MELIMPKMQGSTIKITNAIVALNVFTKGTYLLQVTGRKDLTHAGIWLDKDELLEIKQLIDETIGGEQ